MDIKKPYLGIEYEVRYIIENDDISKIHEFLIAENFENYNLVKTTSIVFDTADRVLINDNSYLSLIHSHRNKNISRFSYKKNLGHFDDINNILEVGINIYTKDIGNINFSEYIKESPLSIINSTINNKNLSPILEINQKRTKFYRKVDHNFGIGSSLDEVYVKNLTTNEKNKFYYFEIETSVGEEQILKDIKNLSYKIQNFINKKSVQESKIMHAVNLNHRKGANFESIKE